MFALFAFALACAPQAPAPLETESAPATIATPLSDASRVLVVANQESVESVEIAAYYRQKRSIPRTNLLMISCTSKEDVSPGEYSDQIEKPIREAIKKSRDRIDFIVLTKGVPIRISNSMQGSVDARLGAMNLAIPDYDGRDEEDLKKALNPYFGKDEPFSSETYNFYLVCRLDGYTLAHAKRLVDLSVAAKPKNGLFFFDEADNRKGGGYGEMQATLGQASELLAEKGYRCQLEQTSLFAAPTESLMGYSSWGSNDGAFDEGRYKSLRFYPGALAETFVSTSGRTFLPTKGGQSLIADLIEGGVTGVKGYVSEPYTFALAKPNILFDRYTSGRNLAESFYAASQVLMWKDVVIGDPLCSPYAAP